MKEGREIFDYNSLQPQLPLESSRFKATTFVLQLVSQPRKRPTTTTSYITNAFSRTASRDYKIIWSNANSEHSRKAQLVLECFDFQPGAHREWIRTDLTRQRWYFVLNTFRSPPQAVLKPTITLKAAWKSDIEGFSSDLTHGKKPELDAP